MGAVPNLFEFVIAGALAKPGATAETIATEIASSEPFLRAVRLGLSKPPRGRPEWVMRGTLAKAFSAGTANGMFDRKPQSKKPSKPKKTSKPRSRS
jgi:hypothetical protein